MLKAIGIPYDANSSFIRGSAKGPEALRAAQDSGSANYYAENGEEIVPGKFFTDLGNIEFPIDDPKSAFDSIYEKVLSEISAKDHLISIGGDHSVAYPIIDAHTEIYPQLNVLQFDAHPDLYEDFEGNFYSHASPFARLMEQGRLNSLTQVGISTLTSHQKEQAQRYGVKQIEMKDLSNDFIHELQAPLYISLDLDVLDPAYAPGVAHHEPGGMNTRQLIALIQAIDVPIIGADIVELNPDRDINGVTAMVAYKLFKELAGKITK